MKKNRTKKPSRKKLTLRRDTVRNLRRDTLSQVAGAELQISRYSICKCGL